MPDGMQAWGGTMDRTIETIARIAQTEFDGASLMGVPFMPYIKSQSLENARSTRTTEGYSIWGITLHVLYHKYLATQLLGEPGGLDPFPYEEADWPTVPKNAGQAEWNKLLTDLAVVHGRFIEALRHFSMERWDESLPQWNCTIGQVLDCMACHDLYHVVQMRNMQLTDMQSEAYHAKKINKVLMT
jgi:hypothetical protein